MWKCPECEAMNYEKGACECCGYNGGKENIIEYRYDYTPSRTYEPWYMPQIWC